MSVEFVDTNILIYAHDAKAGPKYDTSVALVERLANDGTGALSLQVLTEFYSAATTKLPMTSERAEAVIVDFGAWTLHLPAHADLVRAIKLQRRYRISWWDALIVNSATQLGCDTLWSEDFSNGQKYGSVTVRNPFV